MGESLKFKLFTAASILAIAAVSLLGLPAPASAAPAAPMASHTHSDMLSSGDCLAACAANQNQAPAYPAAVLLQEDQEEKQEAESTPPDPLFYVLFALREQQGKINPLGGVISEVAIPPDLVKLYANFRF